MGLLSGQYWTKMDERKKVIRIYSCSKCDLDDWWTLRDKRLVYWGIWIMFERTQQMANNNWNRHESIRVNEWCKN